MSELDPEDLDEAVEDCLVNAELYVGGQVGAADPRYRDQIFAALKERGLVGAAGCLTRKGLSEARRACNKYWSDETG